MLLVLMLKKALHQQNLLRRILKLLRGLLQAIKVLPQLHKRKIILINLNLFHMHQKISHLQWAVSHLVQFQSMINRSKRWGCLQEALISLLFSLSLQDPFLSLNIEAPRHDDVVKLGLVVRATVKEFPALDSSALDNNTTWIWRWAHLM